MDFDPCPEPQAHEEETHNEKRPVQPGDCAASVSITICRGRLQYGVHNARYDDCELQQTADLVGTLPVAL